MPSLAQVSPQTIIRGLDDIRLVPTRYTVQTWTAQGREEETREQLQAELFKAAGQPPEATIVYSAAMDGSPAVQVVRLDSALIHPRPGVAGAWRMRLTVMPPRRRRLRSIEDEFPGLCLLLWGVHAIPVEDLTTRWHAEKFNATWREASRRAHAAAPRGAVWLDTTAAALVEHNRRSIEMAERQLALAEHEAAQARALLARLRPRPSA
jgi:hypothetical protein